MKTMKIDCYESEDGQRFFTKEEALTHEKEIGIKSYYVEIYYTGSCGVRVKARSEEEAKELARDEIYPEDICFEESEIAVEEEG